MSSRFKKAVRGKSRLRLALDGPAGSGKTYTALECAFALGSRVAFIDTEHGSATKYVNENPGWDFDHLDLTSYSPSSYAEAIEDAGHAKYDVVVIDSLSHAWEGKDGALDMADKSADKNKFAAWKNITPMHRRMVEAMLASPCHVIATMRTKTEYVLEQDEKGRSVPRRVGTKPIQREGMEYEFDIVCDLDLNHILTVSKTRCRSIDGLIVTKPTGAFLDPVIRWLETGETVERAAPSYRISDEQVAEIVSLAGELGWKTERAEEELPAKYGCMLLTDLSGEQAENFAAWLRSRIKLKASRPPAKGQGNGAAANGTNGAASASTNGAAAPSTNGNGNGHRHVDDEKPAAAIDPNSEFARDEQLEELQAIRRALKLPADAYKKILERRGVETASKLTVDQADDLLAKLREKIKVNAEAAGLAAAGAGAMTKVGTAGAAAVPF